MKTLISSHLYGGGLVLINTPELCKRYNACLVAIGQEPTKLENFRIDAVGWSPEVASEKSNMDYLSLGAANRFAIVLTPEQSGLPVYRPVHSFDRVAMEKIFKNAKSQIADLTGRVGVWFDFSHELTRFRIPLDLLTVEWVNITANDTDDMMLEAATQRKLADEFMESDSAWADKDFRSEIIGSAQKAGDLRFRSLVIPELKFTDVRTFYSRAFGGTYVLRDIAKLDQALVMEDGTQVLPSLKNVLIYHVDNPELIDFLENQDIVDVPLGWYKQSAGIATLEDFQELLLADVFYASGEERSLSSLNEGQRKSWLAANESKVDPLIFELERLVLDLKRGISVKEIKLSLELRKLLFRPSRAAQDSEVAERVVWQLIARLAPQDIERLFVRNRLQFYSLYDNSWSTAKKEWVVEYLVDRGHPKSIHQK